MTASARVDRPIVCYFFPCCLAIYWLTYPPALVAVVPKEKLTIEGPIKSYAGKGTSGYPNHRVFCSQCGSPIAHDPEAAPPIIAIKAGTLDEQVKKNLKPVC